MYNEVTTGGQLNRACSLGTIEVRRFTIIRDPAVNPVNKSG